MKEILKAKLKVVGFLRVMVLLKRLEKVALCPK